MLWFRSYEETKYIFIFHTIEMPVDCMCPSNTPFTKKLKIVFRGVAPFFGLQKQARTINYLMEDALMSYFPFHYTNLQAFYFLEERV
jgi:hypothetical protein